MSVCTCSTGDVSSSKIISSNWTSTRWASLQHLEHKITARSDVTTINCELHQHLFSWRPLICSVYYVLVELWHQWVGSSGSTLITDTNVKITSAELNRSLGSFRGSVLCSHNVQLVWFSISWRYTLKRVQLWTLSTEKLVWLYSWLQEGGFSHFSVFIIYN